MPIVVDEVVISSEPGTFGVEGDPDTLVTDLILQLHTLVIESAPGALVVSVVDAGNTADIHFEIDGDEVIVIEPDSDGGLDQASIPVPPGLLAGTHTVTAIQGGLIGTGDFEIINDPPLFPDILGEDADPVLVPGAEQPNGTLHWVFQDLMPGGLGSWVMPMNPQTSEPPEAIRGLNAQATSAGNRFHVSERLYEPEEWTFAGPCPTKVMREKLEDYYALKRRFYLHDHWGRAWKVVFISLNLTPRLSTNWEREQTEEFHDYEATVLVTDLEWVYAT